MRSCPSRRACEPRFRPCRRGSNTLNMGSCLYRARRRNTMARDNSRVAQALLIIAREHSGCSARWERTLSRRLAIATAAAEVPIGGLDQPLLGVFAVQIGRAHV